MDKLRHHPIIKLASSPRVILGLRLLYLAAIAYMIIFWRAFWTPDLLFFMFLLLFILYGQGKRFLISFGPFVLLLLSYDSLRGFATYVNKHVHFTEMIDFDRWIGFGQLPTHWLQQHMYHGHLMWYDFYFYLLYMCHFLVPLVLGVILWKFRPQHYNRFITALLVLSYAGFVTYIIFPAAPPWMAAKLGYIPPLEKLSTDIWFAMGVHSFPTIYEKISPNQVAAVPSLHAAYPTLMTIFVGRAFGWKAALAMIWYPLSVWLGIVYMGEHYVIDALLGILYAIGAYLATIWLFRNYGHKVRALQSRIGQRLRRPSAEPVVAKK